MTYTTTPSENVSFRSELGSFAPVAISDPNLNLVQQFDPSAAKNFDEFFDFVINYPNETIADWKMITNGIIHVDYGDGLIRDMIMDFSGDASMLDVYIRIGNAFTNLTRWGTITTGYFKLNGSDVGPINLSAVTTPEGISAAINTVATYALTYIRYGVNDSGERVPYIVFVNTGLTSIDKSTTGQGALMWELMGGDQLISASQFVSTRLQNVRMGAVDRKIYGSHSSNSYYFYSVDAAMKGFYVVDNDYNQRLCLKPNGITPQLGCIFDSFHFIAGDPANASDLYQSVRSYYEDFESPGSDTYNFDGPITALSTNNKEMYVFTKTSLGLLQA